MSVLKELTTVMVWPIVTITKDLFAVSAGTAILVMEHQFVILYQVSGEQTVPNISSVAQSFLYLWRPQGNIEPLMQISIFTQILLFSIGLEFDQTSVGNAI